MNTPISTHHLFLKKSIILLLVAAGLSIVSISYFKYKNAINNNGQITPATGNDQVNITAKNKAAVTFEKNTASQAPENKPGNNSNKYGIAASAKPDSTEIYGDPTIVKRVLLKKGIYFGDYLGSEDVRVDPPRPKNFLTEVDKYFDLYSVPAWYNHVEKNGPGQFDFSEPDQVADFAVAHGAKIQIHNMVWYVSLPDWLKNGNFTPDQLKDILKNHIQTTMRHFKDKYPGSIIAWDIVNECMEDNATYGDENGMRKNLPIWHVIHKPGSTDPTDYIQLAFEWAHEADPDAKLYWNEYGCEYKGFKMDNWFKVIKKLVDMGVPINGVGFQTHLQMTYDHPYSDLLANMNRFADIGLTSEITEFDVLMATGSAYKPNLIASPTQSDYTKQARVYQGVIDAVLNAKKCDAFILFGEWDPGSFSNFAYKDNNGKPLGLGYPNILDKDMKQKLSFKSLVDEVKKIGQ